VNTHVDMSTPSKKQHMRQKHVQKGKQPAPVPNTSTDGGQDGPSDLPTKVHNNAPRKCTRRRPPSHPQGKVRGGRQDVYRVIRAQRTCNKNRHIGQATNIIKEIMRHGNKTIVINQWKVPTHPQGKVRNWLELHMTTHTRQHKHRRTTPYIDHV
jgi:hypothetical protein